MQSLRVASFLVEGSWVVFAIYWFVTAANTKRTIERMPNQALHRLLVVVGYLLLVVGNTPFAINPRLTATPLGTLIVAVGVTLLGLILAIWARNVLGRNWSMNVQLKETHELVRSGPYRLARHPIYTAILLMTVGTVLLSGRLISWLAVPLVAIGFCIKLRQEERLMSNHFPNEYPSYIGATKMLIPFIV